MTLRDLPDDLHDWIKQQAAAHHRSVNKEVIALLDNLRRELPSARPRPSVGEILAIGERVAQAPVLNARGAEEILDYDENGLPW